MRQTNLSQELSQFNLMARAKLCFWALLITVGAVTAVPRPAFSQALVGVLLQSNVIQALNLSESQVQSLVSLYQNLEYLQSLTSNMTCDPLYGGCQMVYDAQRNNAERRAEMERHGVQQILTAEQIAVLNQMLAGY